MASYNRTIIVGNVTRDVELRHIPSGTAVADIGVAINDREKRGDEWIDVTTFVDVTLWGRTAEVAAEYLSKGSPVLVEGRLRLETWNAKETGEKRSKLKVVADKMQLLGSKNQPGGNQSEAPSSQTTADQKSFVPF